MTPITGAPTEPVKPCAPAPGSLGWLVQSYYSAPEFTGLHKSTRAKRRAILDNIFRDHGTKPFTRMEAKHVQLQIRDPKVATPEAANGRVKALRQVFNWATSPTVGYAATNPTLGVPMLRPNNPDGWHTWTREEVLQYMERHPSGTKARKALAIFVYTGVRISDAVKLGPTRLPRHLAIGLNHGAYRPSSHIARHMGSERLAPP